MAKPPYTTLNEEIAVGANWTSQSFMTVNTGQVLNLNSDGTEGTRSYSTFVNEGLVYDSGQLNVDANLKQTGNNSQIDLLGGNLVLDGSASGGIIGITSGTLEFSHGPSFHTQTPYSAEHFKSTLNFDGTTGTVQFDDVLAPLSIEFRAAQNDILVFGGAQKVADLHLGQIAGGYSASEFSVSGQQLLFHATPWTP